MMEALAFLSATIGILLQPLVMLLVVIIAFQILQYLRTKKELDRQILQELQAIKDSLTKQK
ncbi:hypothetical protein P6P90_07575 [Ectobacillus antri]|jgi:hypothetical protein|uniref:DUF4083 domain-containing protein n=1 Tax=Ectobacillus antri TaxID=2486280 RepID=A0ABT6H602_9BACI|nr:hypothetical protein [Ectobacillus antri]MDG4657518.1 hypothetical protein [Ectobacillus antri]MDG5753831.1 hypothetical protein [Ectobacillus antri]